MELNQLFYTYYGNRFDFNKMDISKNPNDGINFVSRTSQDLGIVSKIKKLQNKEPFSSGLITVTLGGSYLLTSFVQPEPFYTAQNIMVLEPKQHMSFNEKIFYCMCIKKNRFRYSAFGREANRTLSKLELPNEIPKWVNKVTFDYDSKLSLSVTNEKHDLHNREWKPFVYDYLFDIEKGYYNKRPTKIGNVNFISATSSDNGVTDKISKDVIDKIYDGNCITVVNNGASTASAFYQKEQFTSSHDVNILRIKNRSINPYIAMFLIPLINLEKSRFGYGRKWRYSRMVKTKIKLPVNNELEPDWKFMEDYIKSLPYSNKLKNYQLPK